MSFMRVIFPKELQIYMGVGYCTIFGISKFMGDTLYSTSFTYRF